MTSVCLLDWWCLLTIVLWQNWNKDPSSVHISLQNVGFRSQFDSKCIWQVLWSGLRQWKNSREFDFPLQAFSWFPCILFSETTTFRVTTLPSTSLSLFAKKHHCSCPFTKLPPSKHCSKPTHPHTTALSFPPSLFTPTHDKICPTAQPWTCKHVFFLW